jgi:TonB-linked SusC/RagA family outer membrane protein
MKRILQLSFILLFLPAALWAQDRTVTGKVTAAEDGSLVPGASVQIKGTTTGTVTDTDGKFSISVPGGATLVFSFIGFITQEAVVGDRSVVDIKLSSDVKQLSEVVVTAQGIERSKNELPYAAQKVTGEEVSRSRDNNFVNALSGKVSGLQITRNNNLGGSTNVVIRGSKSLTGNNQALFIVDGVPIDNSNTNSTDQTTGRGGYDYGNAAADINPDDIASVNVLKGAAATALYGSRASNGVIMITTKKGAKGLGVTVNSGVTMGFVNKNTFPTYQKKYGAGYGAYYQDQIGTDANGDPIYYEDGPPSDAMDNYFLNRNLIGDNNSVLEKIVPTTEDASYGGKFDPNLLVYQWNAFDPGSPYYQTATPWVGAKNDPTTFFRNPISSSQSIMVDGGNDKGYFKLGYTRNTEEGILPNSKINKDFMNFGAGYNLTKKITTTASINVSSIRGQGRYGTGYDDKNIAGNFRQWWQTNVDVKELKEAYDRDNKNITWNWADPTSASGLAPIYWDNPYWTRYENYQNDSRLRYFGNVSLNYQITDWISVLGRISLDKFDEMQEERYAVGSLSPSQYSRYNRSFSEYNYDLLVNFNKTLSESFTLKGVIGTNIRKTRTESITASTNGGLVVPNLYSLSNSKNAILPPLERDSLLRVDGVFASATVGFRNFLFLDLAGRRDKSSALPEGNNVYYYPSISTSFVFAELLKNNLNWLTAGKVRVNYAEVGGTANPYSTKDSYDKPGIFGSTTIYSVAGTKNNPALKPERTRSFEAGLEMSFLDSRLGFDFTYYKQNTVDQIVPLSVSRATGYNFKYINAGNVENRGVELTAFVTPVKTPSFSWTVNVNWTRNRNEVKELLGIDNLQLASFQAGVSVNAALGQPYGTIRGQNFVYNENGEKIVGANGYYQRSATSNEIIGNVNPDWIGGISNTLTYKNLAFSFLIDTRKGGDIFSLDMYYGLATGLYPETAGLNDLGNPVRNTILDGGGVILPGVKADGTPNDIRVPGDDYGVFGYRRNPAAAFVYDASFVKLREVSLTYSLPQGILAKIAPVKSVDFSLIGRNLMILHKDLPYADPEDGLSSGNYQGFQTGSYPSTRNIGFNVRLRF